MASRLTTFRPNNSHATDYRTYNNFCCNASAFVICVIKNYLLTCLLYMHRIRDVYVLVSVIGTCTCLQPEFESLVLVFVFRAGFMLTCSHFLT